MHPCDGVRRRPSVYSVKVRLEHGQAGASSEVGCMCLVGFLRFSCRRTLDGTSHMSERIVEKEIWRFGPNNRMAARTA